MEEKRSAKILVLMVSIFFLFLNFSYSLDNELLQDHPEFRLDKKVAVACNQIMNNIHRDILKLKHKYNELEAYDKGSLGSPDSQIPGFQLIDYNHNYEASMKGLYRFSGKGALNLEIALGPIDYINSFQQERIQYNYTNINVAVFVVLWTDNNDLKDKIMQIVKDNIKPLEAIENSAGEEK